MSIQPTGSRSDSADEEKDSPERNIIFFSKKPETKILKPLSSHDDLGLVLEREFDEIGDQGLEDKYGKKTLFKAALRFPETQNMPLFDGSIRVQDYTGGLTSDPDANVRAVRALHILEEPDTDTIGQLERLAIAVSALAQQQKFGRDSMEMKRALQEFNSASQDLEGGPGEV